MIINVEVYGCTAIRYDQELAIYYAICDHEGWRPGRGYTDIVALRSLSIAHSKVCKGNQEKR